MKQEKYNLVGKLRKISEFPCFRPYLPQCTSYIFPRINKDITIDEKLYKRKTIKSKEYKYKLISNLRILQGILLFQAVAAPMDDTLPKEPHLLLKNVNIFKYQLCGY